MHNDIFHLLIHWLSMEKGNARFKQNRHQLNQLAIITDCERKLYYLSIKDIYASRNSSWLARLLNNHDVFAQ